MRKEDFLYALENAWIIECERTDNKIDVKETVESWQFDRGCYCNGEWFSPLTVYRILEDEWVFDD